MKMHIRLQTLVRSALFLAIALLLPFITGQIPVIGKMLCPMHLPILLCGYFCGPIASLIIGLIAPFLRFAIFGMPTIMPTAIIMSVELATYGISAALLFRYLPKNKIMSYVSLILALLIGRITWAATHVIFFYTINEPFSWEIFLTAGFINAIPGIILQLILIPLIVNRIYYHKSVTPLNINQRKIREK